MIRIHLMTGTAFTESIDVEGNLHDDLIELLDEYYNDHGEFPVAMYHPLDDLEELSEEEMEEMIPINGGEYYLEGIAHVEEIEEEVESEEIYYEEY